MSITIEEHAASGIPTTVTIAVDGTECSTYPSRASLRIEGSFARRDGSRYPARDLAKLVDRLAFGFDEAKYRLDGVEVESVRHPGVCVSHRRATAHRCHECTSDAASGPAFPDREHVGPRTRTDGSFVLNLPLNLVFGFCEDHVGPVSGYRHEILLVRGGDAAVFAAAGVEQGTMTVAGISLLMPRAERVDSFRSKATFRRKRVHVYGNAETRVCGFGTFEWHIDAGEPVAGLTLAFNCPASIKNVRLNGRAPPVCGTQVMPYPGNTVFPFAETDRAIRIHAQFDDELPRGSVAHAVSRHPVSLLV